MPHQLTLIIITIVATSLVALFVVLRNPKSEIARSYVVLISFFVLWAIGQGVMYLSSSPKNVYIAEVLTDYLGLAIAWSFLRFAYLFPNRSYNVRKSLIYFLGIASILISIFFPVPGFIIDTGSGWSPGYAFQANKFWFAVYIFLFFTIFIYAFLILFKKYIAATAENKILLLHVIYSSLIPVLAGSICNLLLIEFGQLRYQIYGPSFTLFFTLTVAYLIFIRGKR